MFIVSEFHDLLGNTHSHAHKLTCGLLHVLEPLVHPADVCNVPESPRGLRRGCRCCRVHTSPDRKGFLSPLRCFYWGHITRTGHSGLELWSDCKMETCLQNSKRRHFFSSQKANEVKLLCHVPITQLVALNEYVWKFRKSCTVRIYYYSTCKNGFCLIDSLS